MTGDFFELDLTDMDINGLITKLNRIDNAVSKTSYKKSIGKTKKFHNPEKINNTFFNDQSRVK